MSEIKTVALIGAGGNLGPAILKEFLASSFKVTVLTRPDSKSTFPSNVNVIKTDYSSPSSLAKAFEGQDAIVSIVGGEGYTVQKTIIDEAIKAGVRRFIPSEFGSDTVSAETRAIVPFFEGKKEIVDYLKTKESETFSWTSLITGPFFDWGYKIGFLGFNLQSQTATLFDGGNIPWTSTNLRTIGTALVNLLYPSNVSTTANKYVYISSHTATQTQLLEISERQTGKKWTVEHVQTKESIPAAKEKLRAGDHTAAYALIQAAAFGEMGYGDLNKVEGGLWNERLGLPKEDLEADVKAVLEGKRP